MRILFSYISTEKVRTTKLDHLACITCISTNIFIVIYKIKYVLKEVLEKEVK